MWLKTYGLGVLEVLKAYEANVTFFVFERSNARESLVETRT